MTTKTVEQEITNAVQKTAPYATDIISGWIRDSMTGNKYIVSEMQEAKFKFVSNDKMLFTALVKAYIGNDFDEAIIAKVVWNKTGTKITREFLV